jgi:copper homeostasis protein
MLEIITQTPEDAIAAQLGGATQIDLKADFIEDGVTPTAGMVKYVCESVNIDVIVMIRSRVNGMVLSSKDIKIMCHDIKLSRKRGAAGFLLGALTKEKEIDLDAIYAFQEAAEDKPIHFHLAWEMTRKPEETLEKLIEIGIKSVRTTGGQGLGGKVENGIEKVRRFKEIASHRIDLLLAGGVNKDNISNLVVQTGIINAHAGSSVRKPPNPKGIVIEEKVRELRKALEVGIKKYKSE